jgi:hypothetical protein
VYLFVATLGYSRRVYVRAFGNERQDSWFAGLEGAFGQVNGILGVGYPWCRPISFIGSRPSAKTKSVFASRL